MSCAHCSGLLGFTLSLAWEDELQKANMCGCCRSRYLSWLKELLHSDAVTAYAAPPPLADGSSSSEQPNLVECMAEDVWCKATHHAVEAFSWSDANAYTRVAYLQGRCDEIYMPVAIGTLVHVSENVDGWSLVEADMEGDKWSDARAWVPTACLAPL